jgi:uncharacterized protein (TIGR00369 family)
MNRALQETLVTRLERSPFWQRVGFRLERCAPGSARLRLPYHVDNTTAASALHGGAIAATLDVAGSLAAWAAELTDDLAGRTLACDVSYIAGALGEDILGQSEVLRRGKEIVYSAVRAVNGAGKLLASGTHIYHFAKPEAVPTAPACTEQPPQLGRSCQGLGALPAADDSVVARNVAMLEKMDGRMPYMAQLGWKFRTAAFGYIEYDLPWLNHTIGDDGGIAGGALLSAVDHAGSLAAWMTTELGNRGLFGSTINTKLQTFAPAIRRDCVVRARAVGGSGALVNSEVNIQTRAGEPVASGGTVYRIVRRDGA